MYHLAKVLPFGYALETIKKTRYTYMYIEKKYPYNCFMMTLYQSLLSASVSSFLCTRNLRPEEIHYVQHVHV